MSENQNSVFDEEEIDQVTLTLDDGSELVCDIMAIYPCGDTQYIALLPDYPEDYEGDSGDIFLYRFVENGDDIELIDIEDDDEFQKASDAFDEFMDSDLAEEELDD